MKLLLPALLFLIARPFIALIDGVRAAARWVRRRVG